MSKILAVMILFNVLMGVAFAYSNYYIWNTINPLYEPYASWGPFVIDYAPKESDVVAYLRNYPFILFWVAMIGNILFAVLILRSKKAS